MRWLVHGKVTPAALDALKRHEQLVKSLAEVELPKDAPASDVIIAARKAQLEILTADDSIIDAIYEQRVSFDGRVVVFLQLEGGDVEQDDAIDRLFARYKRLSPGRLYTVTATRVKVRQLPGKQ